MIEMSPDRGNLLYAAKYLDKNDPIEMTFSSLIFELKANNVSTPRTIIYCQTRKQCSVVYRIFEVYLGKDMYHEQPTPQNRMVEMYHAGTAKSVKDHVLQNMTKDTGHIRVLICTIAFGMGVNCKSIRRIVHFGPSKSVEQYVQECGCAGRDGLASVCVLLFNGLLSAHCSKDMKKYGQLEECRCKWLMNHFGIHDIHSTLDYLHQCCDICARVCKCQNGNCTTFQNPGKVSEELSFIPPDITKAIVIRTVTQQEKVCLREKTS